MDVGMEMVGGGCWWREGEMGGGEGEGEGGVTGEVELVGRNSDLYK